MQNRLRTIHQQSSHFRRVPTASSSRVFHQPRFFTGHLQRSITNGAGQHHSSPTTHSSYLQPMSTCTLRTMEVPLGAGLNEKKFSLKTGFQQRSVLAVSRNHMIGINSSSGSNSSRSFANQPPFFIRPFSFKVALSSASICQAQKNRNSGSGASSLQIREPLSFQSAFCSSLRPFGTYGPRTPRPRVYLINEAFQKLGIMTRLVDILVNQLGYKEPTEVQQKMVKLGVRGHNVIASAQTGTGKTAAFMLPVLDRVFFDLKQTEKDPRNARSPGQPYALILAPTRELVEQLGEYAEKFVPGLGDNIKILTLFGNVNEGKQIDAISSVGADILVSTTGRLLQILQKKDTPLDLSRVKILVMDECDRLFNMGFIPDIRAIYQHLPKPILNRNIKIRHRGLQVMMVTATLLPQLIEFMKFIVPTHHLININQDMAIPETVKHIIYEVSARRKYSLLKYFLKRKKGTIHFFKHPILVFVRTIQRAERLVESLKEDGFIAEAVHGDMSISKRERAQRLFKKNEVQILVATDIMSRGIDIPYLPYVVNYDIPHQKEDYVHRIGRTGRAGATGTAISFVSKQSYVVSIGNQIAELNEQHYISSIEDFLGKKILRSKVPGPWADSEVEEEMIVPDFLKEKVEERKEELLKESFEGVQQLPKFRRNQRLKRLTKLADRADHNELSLRDFKGGRFEEIVSGFSQKSAVKKGITIEHNARTGKKKLVLKKH